MSSKPPRKVNEKSYDVSTIIVSKNEIFTIRATAPTTTFSPSLHTDVKSRRSLWIRSDRFLRGNHLQWSKLYKMGISVCHYSCTMTRKQLASLWLSPGVIVYDSSVMFTFSTTVHVIFFTPMSQDNDPLGFVWKRDEKRDFSWHSEKTERQPTSSLSPLVSF